MREGESKQFVSTLQRSRDLFWKISKPISALNHVAALWSHLTVQENRKKLNVDELRLLLSALDQAID